MSYSIKKGLSEADLPQAQTLAAVCNAYEGLDLKLHLSIDASDNDADHFLYYENGKLLGFWGIDDGMEPELCGMVRPDHRRKGLGRALFEVAAAECKRRGAATVLLICEAASHSGRAFVEAVGGKLDFTEHRMVLDLEAYAENKRPPLARQHLALRMAGERDTNQLALLESLSFGQPQELTLQRVTRDLHDPACEFHIAELDGKPISSLKLIEMGSTTGIYGFGVVPAQRGRGLGRQFLSEIIDTLLAQGRTHITLEVNSTNPTAIGLYRSMGFKETTVYGYYKLSV